jgi:hypothetical protein
VKLIALERKNCITRGKFGHIDGARDGMTKVCGSESELEQADGRYFLLEFQWRALDASHPQQL